MTDPPTRLVVETTVDAPPAVVWPALRDPGMVRNWFGWEHRQLDDEIALIFDRMATEQPDQLGLDIGEDRIVLVDERERCRVQVLRSAEPAEAHDPIDEGWTTFVHQLRFALERHPDESRRTVRLTASVRPDGPASGAEAVGLDDVAASAVGTPWMARPADGEHAGGEVLFRTEHQVGIVLPALGDGLVVLVSLPRDAEHPHGRAEAVLNVYGQDEAGLAEVRDRWQGAWEACFDDVRVVTAATDLGYELPGA